jgi:predicted RNA-binding Zn-ribbon protein involved in translation (DUF1610 family)
MANNARPVGVTHISHLSGISLGPDSGPEVECPGCGQSQLWKSIDIRHAARERDYVCSPCGRAFTRSY